MPNMIRFDGLKNVQYISYLRGGVFSKPLKHGLNLLTNTCGTDLILVNKSCQYQMLLWFLQWDRLNNMKSSSLNLPWSAAYRESWMTFIRISVISDDGRARSTAASITYMQYFRWIQSNYLRKETGSDFLGFKCPIQISLMHTYLQLITARAWL